MTTLEIVRTGPLASLQDEGRPGLARLGIPRAGTMDLRALHLANALVGNPAGEAAIEMAWAGLTLRPRGGQVRLALAGAPAAIRIGDRHVPHHASFDLDEGETVTIENAERGVFMVLAIAGGLDIAPVLASRSLYARSALGGFAGRHLAAGDMLPVRICDRRRAPLVRAEPLPIASAPTLRVVPGPEDTHFTADALRLFCDKPFRLSEQSDRMAYRLTGAPLERVTVRDMVSTGTHPGAVQVPPDGQPLVLMADCQTVGGYPRIATVISADLPILAQCRPGAVIRFSAISLEDAHRAARVAAAAPLRLAVMAASHALRTAGSAPLDLDYPDCAVNALDPATWDVWSCDAACRVAQVLPGAMPR